MINRVKYCLALTICPRSFFSWRSFLLRLFGAKIGRKVHIYPSVKIYLPWNLEIDDYSCIGEWSLIYNLGFRPNSEDNLQIDNVSNKQVDNFLNDINKKKINIFNKVVYKNLIKQFFTKF